MIPVRIKDLDVALIGDVHKGKRFITGVPLHRRGEREAWVLKQFTDELWEAAKTSNVIVQVGDLFDRFSVPLDDIMEVAEAIETVAGEYTEKGFFFLRGNHDASKDLEKVSAFEILTYMLRSLSNVNFVRDTRTWWPLYSNGERLTTLGFVGWDPIKTAAEQVRELPECDAIFGHWDVVDFSEDKKNLIPISELSDKTKLVFTGHDHTTRRFGISGRDGAMVPFGDSESRLNVTVTGSMQPYSHGEDPEHKLYVTMTKVEVERTQPFLIKDKCVRVMLADGETLPENIDCLQLTALKEKKDGEEQAEVDLGSFNMETLFLQAFAEEGVDQSVTEELLTKYRSIRNAA